jgi:hypothetical protein
MLNEDPRMATAGTYAERFGSFSRALALVRESPKGGFCINEHRARLKLTLQDEFAEKMADLQISSKRRNGTFRSSAHPPLLLDVALCRVLDSGDFRWEIRYPLTGISGLRCITLRLNKSNKVPLDYLLFRTLPPGNQRYRFSEEKIQRMASSHATLDEAITCLLRDDAPARQ